MARLNKVIDAFSIEELSLLSEIMDHEEERALKDGYILTEPFQELKHSIQSAKRFSAAMRKEHVV